MDSREWQDETIHTPAVKESGERGNAALRAQYTSLYSHLTEHKKYMWQIPAASASIVGVLVGLAFSLPEIHWVIRELLISIGALVSYSLLSQLVKHRYFSYIWLRTLQEMEREFGLKRVQMTTTTNKCEMYWYSGSPRRRLERRSSDDMAVNTMWVVLILLIGLLIFVPVLAYTGTLQ